MPVSKPPPLAVAVWAVPSKLVKVTFAPAFTVSFIGEYMKLRIAIFALVAGADAPDEVEVADELVPEEDEVVPEDAPDAPLPVD